MENLADKCKADIVALVTTIREQIRSRSVPESNKKIMLKKLAEIQKVFDANYVDIDTGDETESMTKNENETMVVTMETYPELQTKNDKGKKNMNSSVGTVCDQPEMDKERSQGQTNEGIPKVSDRTGTTVENRPVISSGRNTNEQNKGKDNLENMDTDTDDGGNGSRTKSDNSDVQADNNVIVNVDEYVDNMGRTIDTVCTVEDGNTGVVIDEIKEEDGNENVEKLGEEVGGDQRDDAECVEVIEKKKLDGTEAEVSGR